MKKVLYIIDTLQVGGAEKSLLEIVKNLKLVTPIMCTLFAKNDDLKNDFLAAGIKVYSLGLDNERFWFLNGRARLYKLISDIRPDIIHAHLFKSEFLVRITDLRSGIISVGAFVNDSYAKERFRQQNCMQNVKLKIVQRIDAITAKRVNYFTSITNAILKTNCQALSISPDKVKVIYRGRDLSKFNVTQISYNSQNDQFVFLVVARLLRRKGFFELLEAALILKKVTSHNFIIKIAGDGADGDLIKDFSHKLGLDEVVKFLGTRSDVLNLLASSHCFVLPSHYEGQGGSLVEAMLAGKPLIASKIEVFEEQIENGVTGYLFELMNAQDLYFKMLHVMDNYSYAIEMGSKARTQAEEKFNIEMIAKQHDVFYTKILQV